MKLIDKSALVAEIERQLNIFKYDTTSRHSFGRMMECNDLLVFINTLEVKEVDLEKEVNNWRHNHFHGKRDKDASGEYLERISQLDLAKYFFELGLKAQKGEEL